MQVELVSIPSWQLSLFVGVSATIVIFFLKTVWNFFFRKPKSYTYLVQYKNVHSDKQSALIIRQETEINDSYSYDQLNERIRLEVGERVIALNINCIYRSYT